MDNPMKQFFIELLEYSHQCNQRLIEAMMHKPDKTSEKSIKLFSHILNAHQIWNNRIAPGQQAVGVWEVQPMEDWEKMENTNHEKSLSIMEKFELSDIIHITLSNGTTFQKSVQQILFHIINHGTYHRAQIATEFRQYGLDPLSTDYILFKQN